ncbi:MAG: CoA transferase [Actinomycetota bacterium]
MSTTDQPGPLAGIRVVEFAQALATPSCGALLSDMGADVIKVEPPRGDSYRLLSRTHVSGEGRDFAIANRGKRSICIDLAHPDAAVVVDPLVADADVVLVSMKAPDAPRYGLDYERLRTVRSDLVYLQNTPYGVDGPYADDGGYDVVAMGLGGMTSVLAMQQGDHPQYVRPALADVVTGIVSTLGVVAALRHRDLTGDGQWVRTSLLHTTLALIAHYAFHYDDLDGDRFAAVADAIDEIRTDGGDFAAQQAAYGEHFDARPSGNVYFRHYRTADGFISVGCLSPRLNERFREATGLVDPRRTGMFERGSDAERAAVDLFVAEAEALLAEQTTEQWRTTFSAHGVPSARVNFPHEIYDDPQALANSYVAELDHRDLGRYRTPTAPLQMGRTPVRTAGHSPRRGEHTAEILAELGLDSDQRADLIERGIAGPHRGDRS